MTVITVSREFGSGGDLLAERVANSLGYHLVDKIFISKILCQYGVAEFDIEYEKQPGFWESFDIEKRDRRETMVRVLNLAVQMIARHGNVVILGRSGYAILPGRADVLHVRLQAPFDDRVETIRIEQNISRPDAFALVNEKDKIRTSFIESFYHVPWNAPQAFDLTLNTAKVPIDVAASWVIEASKLISHRLGNKLTTKEIEIDPIMMQAITEKLNCTLEHADD